VSDLTCLPAGLDSRSIITSPNICTTPCETDADCTSHPLIRRYGFCKEGLCRFGGSTGEVCSRDGECVSGTCVLAGATEGQCV
jgi:hypothetical protein